MTSTAADTFARFVAVLADTMDDHDTDGEALASRVHLSRFHCDRLVSAAAGEPPAALRRRILLERAAYQLITTDHDILRVAVEAGYASNGRSPARSGGPSGWRRRGGGPGRRRSGCRRRARCTSTRPGACASPPTGR